MAGNGAVDSAGHPGEADGVPRTAQELARQHVAHYRSRFVEEAHAAGHRHPDTTTNAKSK